MSMGDTLTWEGSVPEFGARRARVRKHILHYKVRFLVGFPNTSTKTVPLKIEVESYWPAEKVAEEMVKRWKKRRPRPPYPLRNDGAKLIFTIPNNAVAVHAFKSWKVPNGKVVPAYPLALEVLPKLKVSTDLFD